MKKFYLSFSVFIFIVISSKAEDMESKINNLYNNLIYQNFNEDSLRLNEFKASILKIGPDAIPYLFEIVNQDTQSLKLFAVALTLNELYNKPPFDEIIFYNLKYQSKNINWLCVALMMHSYTKYIISAMSNFSPDDTTFNCNFSLNKEIIPILIKGLEYNKFIIQYLLPIHEQETISSISLVQLSLFCNASIPDFIRLKNNKKRIKNINKWWKKNHNNIEWSSKLCSFVIK